MKSEDATSSVPPSEPSGAQPAGQPTATPPPAHGGPASGTTDARSQPAPGAPGDADGPVVPPRRPFDPAPRWSIILAWSTGLAGLYVLASLAHAALIERLLSVDVGFGRSLAFWVGTIYLALLGWGFLPRQPTGRYARRPFVLGALAFGAVATVVCGAYTALWLAEHWVPAIGGPVTASIAVLVVAAVGVLWLAGRDERRSRTPATD